MFESEKSVLVKYIPAQLHECKEWVIKYYVVNPATNQLHRKIVKVNRVKKIAERRRWAREIIHEINIKLATGWNPFIEQQSAKSYHKLFDALETFEQLKEKELRPDSVRSYKSYIKIIKDYIIEKKMNKNMYVISFDKAYALDFLQFLYLKKNISERYYNNNVKFYRTFFNWCVQYNYCNTNPFSGIAMKKEKQKTRILIDIEAKEKLKNYLFTKDYEYFVICMLAFYALLRPKEITYLRVKDIDLENQRIFIPGTVAKNGKDRRPTIPDVLKNYLVKMNLSQYNKEWYLFSRGWKPGVLLVDSREISRTWDHIRNAIKIPKEMQFYSLRDSGITKMIKDGISLEQIRDQADHSSLEITNIYTKHVNTKGSEDIKKMCLEF
jgi:site-specific recombinase XerD